MVSVFTTWRPSRSGLVCHVPACGVVRLFPCLSPAASVSNPPARGFGRRSAAPERIQVGQHIIHLATPMIPSWIAVASSVGMAVGPPLVYVDQGVSIVRKK